MRYFVFVLNQNDNNETEANVYLTTGITAFS